MNKRWIGIAILCALTWASPALLAQEEEGDADAATLGIGSPAPALAPGKWIQGEAVKSFESGKVYVVEFWATWCAPCRKTIPHLNELQEKFKDKGVVVIGQDVWERGQDVEPTVSEFIKKMGTNMTYRVALDDTSGDRRGKMAVTWMIAAQQRGIPAAFVVNGEGKIVWIGHPAIGLDEALDAVLAGKLDVAQAKKMQEEQGDKMDASREEVGRRLKIIQERNEEMNKAMSDKNWDKALSVLDALEKDMSQWGHVDLSVPRFRLLLLKKDGAAAGELAGRILEKQPDNALMLNEVAWALLTTPDLEPRDVALAKKIAERANDVSSGDRPDVLDTLARALFMAGDKEKALELQKKAVDKCDEEDLKPLLQKTLDAYTKGTLPPPPTMPRGRTDKDEAP
jgi:thiol-disulfide isomerase/thioredoxin